MHQHDLLPTVRQFLPGADVLWTSQEGCNEIRRLASNTTSVVTYAHSVSDVGRLSARIDADLILAASEFVADSIGGEASPHSAIRVLRPPVERCCDIAPPKPVKPAVLFVNPVREKGVDRVLRLAARLDYKFNIVEGWRPDELSSRSLPENVEVSPRTPFMHVHYQQASVVLVPSIVPEGAGRVAIEAGLHRRPVVASRVGGLMENVAEPSLLLDPTGDDDEWLSVIDSLMRDRLRWDAASAAQAELSRRRMPVPSQVKALLEKL